MSANSGTQSHQAIIVNCAVCGSDDYRPRFHLPHVRIVVCDHCGLEYVRPIPWEALTKDYVFPPLTVEALGTEIDLDYLKRVFDKYHIVNCRLLDLGCGPGRLGPGLIKVGWDQKNLYFMDYSESELDFARLICPSANFLLRDARQAFGLVDFFDCIIMVEFFEDVTDPKSVMRNALDALKVGGLLIIRGMPNNESVEAFVGRDRWKMRAVDHHYSFFNPRTFSQFLDNFPQAQLLEFGCFLQEGYRFYNVYRFAKDIGLLNKYAHRDGLGATGTGALPRDEIARQILNKLKHADFNMYPHRARLPVDEIGNLLTAPEIEAFFDRIHLDYRLAPDFSAVIQKTGGESK